MTIGYLPPLWMQKTPKKSHKRKSQKEFLMNHKNRPYAFSFNVVIKELMLAGYRKEAAVREIVKQAKSTRDIRLKTAISVQILQNQGKTQQMTRLLEQMCNEEEFDPGLTTIRHIKGGKLEMRDECYFDMKLRDAILKEKGETINVNHGGLAGVLAGIGNDTGSKEES